MSLTELAASAQIPTSNAHLYLVSFRNVGLVAQKESGRYVLGPYAMQLGLAAIASLEIVSLALDPMQKLRDKTGEAAYLSLWGNRGPCIVSKIDGTRQIPMSIKVGYVLPLFDTATGRVFLAYLPRPVSAPVLSDERGKSDSATETSIKRIVEDVRARGMARTDGRLNQGFVALAAPIFDHAGAIAASLALLGPSATFDARFNSTNARLLTKTTTEISSSLGYSSSRALESLSRVQSG